MSAIIDFFSSIVNFLVSIVESIFWLTTTLPRLIVLLGDVVAYSPSFLVNFLMISVSATAVFAIMKLL